MDYLDPPRIHDGPVHYPQGRSAVDGGDPPDVHRGRSPRLAAVRGDDHPGHPAFQGVVHPADRLIHQVAGLHGRNRPGHDTLLLSTVPDDDHLFEAPHPISQGDRGGWVVPDLEFLGLFTQVADNQRLTLCRVDHEPSLRVRHRPLIGSLDAHGGAGQGTTRGFRDDFSGDLDGLRPENGRERT
jgi:hypothetical protein